jgi:hypothetical protein
VPCQPYSNRVPAHHCMHQAVPSVQCFKQTTTVVGQHSRQSTSSRPSRPTSVNALPPTLPTSHPPAPRLSYPLLPLPGPTICTSLPTIAPLAHPAAAAACASPLPPLAQTTTAQALCIKEWFGLREAASDVQLWECTTFLWMTNPIFSFRVQLPLCLGGSVHLHNGHLRRCRISCAVVMCTGWHCLCTSE